MQGNKIGDHVSIISNDINFYGKERNIIKNCSKSQKALVEGINKVKKNYKASKNNKG